MTRVRYLTHPQVEIDPARDVTRWRLSDMGHARVRRLCDSPVLAQTTRVISSAETKAVETATPLAKALGVTAIICAETGENDRSATGYLPPAMFEQVADAFFSAPDTSVRGWETARAAQNRIVEHVNRCLASHDRGDVLIVGHGAVGTLLFCALNGYEIDRCHDQPPGGGSYFTFDTPHGNVHHPWRPMEAL